MFGRAPTLAGRHQQDRCAVVLLFRPLVVLLASICFQICDIMLYVSRVYMLCCLWHNKRIVIIIIIIIIITITIIIGAHEVLSLKLSAQMK